MMAKDITDALALLRQMSLRLERLKAINDQLRRKDRLIEMQAAMITKLKSDVKIAAADSMERRYRRHGVKIVNGKAQLKQEASTCPAHRPITVRRP